ncbi:CAP domain-containing protein [bacterium]|nr:CAP domain-containing protein [bacterium]
MKIRPEIAIIILVALLWSSCSPPPLGYKFKRGGHVDSKAARVRFTRNNIHKKALEQVIFEEANWYRRQHGLEPFRHHVRLQHMARMHSQEMTDKQYFAHQSPDPANRTIEYRLRNSGLDFTGQIAENIAVTFTKPAILTGYDPVRLDEYPYFTYGDFANQIVVNWMNSKGHRHDMLNPNLTFMGIGIARGPFSQLDAVYVTQNFSSTIDIHQKQVLNRTQTSYN